MKNKCARQFVQKMREDQRFRVAVQGVTNKARLWEYLYTHGYAFDELDLVKAMAACMAELEAGGR